MNFENIVDFEVTIILNELRHFKNQHYPLETNSTQILNIFGIY